MVDASASPAVAETLQKSHSVSEWWAQWWRVPAAFVVYELITTPPAHVPPPEPCVDCCQAIPPAAKITKIDARWCGVSDHISIIDEIVGLLDESE
jgi:hypothetical protein